MKTTVGHIAAAACVLAATVTGCGGGDTTSTPSSPTAQQVTQPPATGEAAGGCNKDMLARPWQRLDGADPPLKSATTWTFIPAFDGADHGKIECDGDCDRALGKPLSYELNQPTMQSRMKVQFEKEESVYYCKVKPDELTLGPMTFGPAEARPVGENITYDSTYVTEASPSQATVVIRNGRIVSFAEEAAGAGKCELAIQADFTIGPPTGEFSGSYTGAVSSGPSWCVPTDGTMSGRVEGAQMTMIYTNAASGLSSTLHFVRT
ncbi:MAG: hypothetical protein ACPGVG_08065 [Mycobacterium sp.]